MCISIPSRARNARRRSCRTESQWPRASAAAALSAFGIGVRAATLLVPSQYPTIQAAVDASRDGDVVLVSPGTAE
jgi:hypothetical protein